MKKLIDILAGVLLVICAVIIYVQAENNKQLIYDLNVSQTALMIQKAKYNELNQQIAEGLCLPRLEGFAK